MSEIEEEVDYCAEKLTQEEIDDIADWKIRRAQILECAKFSETKDGCRFAFERCRYWTVRSIYKGDEKAPQNPAQVVNVCIDLTSLRVNESGELIVREGRHEHFFSSLYAYKVNAMREELRQYRLWAAKHQRVIKAKAKQIKAMPKPPRKSVKGES